MATLDQMDQYLQIRPQCMHSILSLDLGFESVTFKVSICFTKVYQFLWFWGVMFLLYVSTYMYNVRLKKYCVNNEKWSKTYMFGKKLNQERLYKNSVIQMIFLLWNFDRSFYFLQTCMLIGSWCFWVGLEDYMYIHSYLIYFIFNDKYFSIGFEHQWTKRQAVLQWNRRQWNTAVVVRTFIVFASQNYLPFIINRTCRKWEC